MMMFCKILNKITPSNSLNSRLELYLFNNGKWSNLQTTGFYAISGRYSERKPYIYFDGASKPLVARTNQTINLTNYNYLKIDIGSITEGYYYAGVSQNASLNSVNPSSYNSAVAFSGPGIAILNLSAITGNYYIYMFSSNVLSTCVLAQLYLTTV